jgi:hypothetical protein
MTTYAIHLRKQYVILLTSAKFNSAAPLCSWQVFAQKETATESVGQISNRISPPGHHATADSLNVEDLTHSPSVCKKVGGPRRAPVAQGALRLKEIYS